MGRYKKNTITPKQFHKLWDAANKEKDVNDYVRDTLRSGHFKYESCGLKYDAAATLLFDIHKLSTMTFRDILDKAGKRKCEISDNYCVPIRTVEEWYTGNNKCPGYMRLLFLKDFGLLNLKVDIKEKTVEKQTENKKIAESRYIRELLEKTSYLSKKSGTD